MNKAFFGVALCGALLLGTFSFGTTATARVRRGGKTKTTRVKRSRAKAVRPVSRIVFSSTRDGNAEIYVVNADGSKLQRFTRDSGPNAPQDTQPTFNARRTRIAWASTRDGVRAIWTMKADGTDQRCLNELDDGSTNTSPSWSPDGRKIVFVRDNQVHTMNADGSGLKRLTSTGRGHVSPRYTPDGKRIVFARDSSSVAEIYVVNADGSAPRSLKAAPRGRRVTSLHVSPNGQSVLYSLDFQIYDNSDLCATSLDGKTTRTILSDNDIVYVTPTYSPDGTRICFASDRSSKQMQLYTSDLNGQNVRPLLSSRGADFNPDWR